MRIHIKGLGTLHTVPDVVERRAQLRAEEQQEQRAAAKQCSAEKRAVKRQNEIDLRAVQGKGALRSAAAVRRCRIRSSGIKRRAKAADAELAELERAVRRRTARAETEAGTQAARVRRRSSPARDERTGKRLSRDEVDQRVSEARSALAGVDDREGGNSAAALWWFSDRKLRSMLRGLKRGRNLYEAAVESYDDNHRDINAAYFEHVDGEGERADRQRNREATRDYKRRKAQVAHVLHGAPMLDRPVERLRSALVAWGHQPRIGRLERERRTVRCELCHGPGRLAKSSRDAWVFHGSALLQGECPGESTPF